MRFCPKCGTLMMPVKGKNGKQLLRCPKCGYEEEIDAKAKSAYVQKKEIGEDKHRKIAVVEEEKDNLTDEEKEMIEDYQKQLLENLYEDERGGETED
ncbi:MAG: DNA-directed RNA polymerase [Thermocladium sp.]|nr:MAG: hypothetical protein AT710_01830 [Thermocladium sp. ECH_B]